MSETSPPARRLPIRLAGPTAILYAAGYPIGAATVAVMSPFLVISLRFAASAVLLWGVVVARHVLGARGGAAAPRVSPLSDRRKVGHAMIAGLLTQGVQFLGAYWGLAHGVSAGLAALVIALNPVMTAALLAVFLGQRQSRRGVVALGLAAAAVVLACLPKIVHDHAVGPGVIAVIIAMLGLSVGGVYQGRHCSNMDPWVVNALGLTASTPVAALTLLFSPVTTTDLPRALILLTVMVVISSMIGTTLYSACIKRAGAMAAAILFAVIPAITSLIAWAFLGEQLSILTLVGLLLGAGACALQAASARQKGRAVTSDEAPRPPALPVR
ncbi:DMT family transporter [Nocardia callitridis]|uniref:DMT family transporter n=1 Tax=Nocardia callitridis TaxID=648753 RepID=A0ABP9K6B8_9NOCA